MDTTLPTTRRTRRSVGGESPSRKAVDKENATIDLSATASRIKKSRSKSMGLGLSDGLRPGNGNRRASLAVPSRPPPRSILKPTIQPLPEIPPHKPRSKQDPSSENKDPNAEGTKVAVKTEAEQQAAAKEREERERLDTEISERREARRKSLANRRVSFAAEATLHTFHEIEYIQDSTTSTDSTRRASSLTAASAPATPAHGGEDPTDPPSTPPSQVEEPTAESPANQRDLHQRKRRRSSGPPPVNFSSAEEDTLEWGVNSSDSEAADAVIEEQVEDGSSSDDDSDDDGTMVTVEAEDMTSASAASERSGASADSSANLDEALRRASEMARTQSMNHNAHANPPSPDKDAEVVPAIMGWGRKSLPATPAAQETSSQDEEVTEMEMDITQAVGGIIQSAGQDDPTEDNEDMSMDVTKVYGGVLQAQLQTVSSTKPPRKSLRRQSMAESDIGEATMEFTTAVGGIHPASRLSDVTGTDANEDMSMEFTSALGGVMAANKPPMSRLITSPAKSDLDDTAMDLTLNAGAILPPSTAEQEADEESTMGMDITTPLGGIIEAALQGSDRSAGKLVMEKEVDEPGSILEPSSPLRQPSPQRRQSVHKLIPQVAEAGSPDLSAFRGKGLRRSTDRRLSTVPKAKATPDKSSLLRQQSVASQEVLTPTRPSPARSRASASPTPKASTRFALKSAQASPAKASTKPGIFNQDPATGVTTPRVVLTPQRRRLSGLGADKQGLGSPKISEILDRRGSIGDAASTFAPSKGLQGRAVTFEDPRVIEEEIDRNRQHDEAKENGRVILEREADGSNDEKDVTLSLKEMIGTLSPKRKPLNGRKSLHVGSGSILGKRPLELDEDDEDEDDGIKRLKGHQGSPVKNVRLQSPPSKAETTGRPILSSRTILGPTAGNTTTPTLSPRIGKAAPSPKGLRRYRNVETDTITATVNFDEDHQFDENELERDDGRIHLQDFLNMTNIRFMELTTTKRRHTVAPSSLQDSTSAAGEDDMSLERCVVAGACTVPMLELYQHSCRELKKYISEGRRIVRDIETDTFEENPPLFREYMAATPDIKMLMDNQFKNVKTNAKLLSKAMWYKWRMMLQEGLKEGLIKIAEGMLEDGDSLLKQEELLESVMPSLHARLEQLKIQHQDLETAARELADCDPEEIEAARADLISLDEEIEQKTRRLEELQTEQEQTESSITELNEWKQSCLEDIKVSEQIREDCRGWTSNEVAALKERVEKLESEHGWAITRIASSVITMTYRRDIELIIDTMILQQPNPNKANDVAASKIDLRYIGMDRERHPSPATPELEFFAGCVRDLARARGALPQLPQSSHRTKIGEVLSLISDGWDRARHVTGNFRVLDSTFPCTWSKTTDNSIAANVSLLLAPIATKLEVILAIEVMPPSAQSTPSSTKQHSKQKQRGLQFAIRPSARVVYGQHFNTTKVAEFLAVHIAGEGGLVPNPPPPGDRSVKGLDAWCAAFVELRERLLARARR